MGARKATAVYDACYFAQGCGVPYHREEAHWARFFAAVADRIVSDIRPATVLDAGCATGFLVEALRGRHVDACGLDISEYVIATIPADLRPYCWVGSVTEPFPQRYDLIVCIEVLEHLAPSDSEHAVATLCRHTDDVLFSSTPSDYKEPTHFNVQPLEHWAEQFARHGFFRDVDFDASFLTPWAVRFRRSADPIHRVVRDYERRFSLVWKENQDLRTATVEMRQQMGPADRPLAPGAAPVTAALQPNAALPAPIPEADPAAVAEAEAPEAGLVRELDGKRAFVAALQLQLLQKGRDLAGVQTELRERQQILEALRARVADQDRALDAVEASVSWKLLLRTARVTVRVIPPGTRRDRIVRAAVRVLQRQWAARSQSALARPLPGAPPPDAAPPPSPHGSGDGASAPPPPVTGHEPLVAAPDERSAAAEPAAPSSATAVAASSDGRAPSADAYQLWIRDHEPSASQLQEQRERALQLTHRALISIITPVCNPPLDVLRATVDSVFNQTYDNWELCLVDGASADPAVRHLLIEAAERDPRVRVELLDENRGIAGNSNAALRFARGDFVAFLDHDDVLAPHALFEIVATLSAAPHTDIIYFDEDKLSADGTTRREPFFKPDWSPELVLSANYLTHPVIRRSVVDAVGQLDPGMDGAQDWDLILRCTEQTQAIAHIPKVLYHWRQVAGSAAAAFAAKPAAFANQLRAVEQHLRRQALPHAHAAFPRLGCLRVVWPTPGHKVSIIIPTRDKRDLLQSCLTSLCALTSYPNFEIVLVENGSGEVRTWDYYLALLSDPRISIIDAPTPFNYSAANNLGARYANGDLLLFLNNDVEVLAPDWLDELVQWAERPGVGAVGAKLLYADETIQHAGVVIGLEGHSSHVFWGAREAQSGPFGSVDWYRNYLAVTGACMMMRRSVFDAVGGFDERYQLVFSDVEICLRLVTQGYRNVYTPFARLRHREGGSRGLHIPDRDIHKGYEDMKAFVEAGDPYFNPNLSYAVRLPTIAARDEERRIDRLRRIVSHHPTS